MHAYIVLSLLCGIRTEEARALRWAHVDLDGDPAARPPVPPHVAVWRSVRTHGETKTERSRRTLGLPAAAVQALRAWAGSQAGERLAAGDGWQDTGLVFTNHLGAALDAGNVRKMFKRVCAEAGAGDGWTPRELRTTFVSLLSHQGVSIEEIARLAGHDFGAGQPDRPGGCESAVEVHIAADLQAVGGKGVTVTVGAVEMSAAAD
jgi:integrase